MSAAPNAVGGAQASTTPLLLRMLNRVGRAAARPSLDADTLIARAERATGLRDWGDYEFREGLEVLTRSLENEAQLNTIGRLMLRDYLHRTISNRLLLRRDLLANPQIAEVEIKRNPFSVIAHC